LLFLETLDFIAKLIDPIARLTVGDSLPFLRSEYGRRECLLDANLLVELLPLIKELLIGQIGCTE